MMTVLAVVVIAVVVAVVAEKWSTVAAVGALAEQRHST